MTPDSPAFLRLFVAIDITAALRDSLTSVQQSLKRAQADVAWVRPENIHVSLAFIGNTGQDLLPLLALALDTATEGLAAFTVTVTGLGTFGSRKAARVVWAGFRPAAELTVLQTRVAERLREAGVALDRREFLPHLTLGRVRSPRGGPDLAAAVAAGTAAFPDLPLPVRQVRLMQSTLDPAGARHQALHVANLRNH